LCASEQYLWVLSLEVALCHPTSAQNFLVISRFFGKFMYAWIRLLAEQTIHGSIPGIAFFSLLQIVNATSEALPPQFIR